MGVGLQVMELYKELKGASLLGKDLGLSLNTTCVFGLSRPPAAVGRTKLLGSPALLLLLCVGVGCAHRQGCTLLSPKHLKWFKTSLHFPSARSREDDFSYVGVEPSDTSRKCHPPFQCLKSSLTPAWEPQYRGDAKTCDTCMDQWIYSFALQRLLQV